MVASPTRRTIGTVAVALTCTVSQSASAQHDRYAPIVLQVPASTRATGLGGAFVGLRDIESIFSNPALAGVVTGTAVSVARFRASTGAALASSMSLGSFGVSIGAQVLQFNVPVSFADGFRFTDPPPVSSSVLSGIGESVSASASSTAGELAFSATFRGLRWGTALKYVQEQLGDGSDASPAIDLGVAKDGGNYTIGLSVQNLGPDIDYRSVAGTSLPVRATLGIAGFSRPIGPLDVAASLAVSMLEDGFVSPAGGVEWSYSPLEGYNFVVRMGLRRPELLEQRQVTAGASFSLDRFTIDYAFEDLRGGAAHRIGLRVR